MRLNFRRMLASASVLAITGGVLAAVATAGVANAATTPPFEPDPNSIGSIMFFNAAGQQITSGSDDSFMASFAEASTTDPDTPPGTKAALEFANPQPNVNSLNWFTGSGSTNTTFPNTSAPGALASTPNPVVTMTQANGDADLFTFAQSAAPNTVAGFVNVFQVRIVTSAAGGGGTTGGTGPGSGLYWSTDVQIDPTTGAWQQIFPAVQTATSTTLTANPATATVGVPDTLTATVSPATAGSVNFMNGTNSLGTASVNATTGVATMSTTFNATGTQSLSAVFTPTDTTDFSGSTGNLSLTVNPAATPTTTTLAVSQSGTTGSDVSLSATVAASGTPVTAGTVSFFDNGSTSPLNTAPVTPNASGVATFDIPAGLAAGEHSIVAVFTPTDVTQFEASQSAPQSFLLQPPQVGACAQPGSQCTATSNIEATIPVGTLVISTPYTTANPLNLGTLALNSGLTEYTGNAPFSNLEVVDTRAGDLPWTISALASNLSDGGANPGSTICGQNLGLTGLTNSAGAGFAGTVTTDNNPASDPAIAPGTTGCPATAGGLVGTGGTSVTVATASAGLGTDTLSGTLTLNAPVSTEPGLFTGTITFTVG